MKEKKMIKVNLTKKEMDSILEVFDLYKTGQIKVTDDERKLLESVEEKIIEVKSQKEVARKDILEFNDFLDNLYREYHANLDRLGKSGITKLAEVMLFYSDRVIEELKKY